MQIARPLLVAVGMLFLVSQARAQAPQAVPSEPPDTVQVAPDRRVVDHSGGGKSFGFMFRGGLAGDYLTVEGVVPGLPADSAGVRAGDRIIGINGEAVSALSEQERGDRLRGSQVLLLVERDSTRLVIPVSKE